MILVPIMAFAQCLFTDGCTAMKLVRYRNFDMNLPVRYHISFVQSVRESVILGVRRVVLTYSAMR